MMPGQQRDWIIWLEKPMAHPVHFRKSDKLRDAAAAELRAARSNPTNARKHHKKAAALKDLAANEAWLAGEKDRRELARRNAA
jgi:hypothetical protein